MSSSTISIPETVEWTSSPEWSVSDQYNAGYETPETNFDDNGTQSQPNLEACWGTPATAGEKVLYGICFDDGLSSEKLKQLLACQNQWGIDLMGRINDRDFLQSSNEGFTWKSSEQEEEEYAIKFEAKMKKWSSAVDNSAENINAVDRHVAAEAAGVKAMGDSVCESYTELDWSLLEDFTFRGRENELSDPTPGTRESGDSEFEDYKMMWLRRYLDHECWERYKEGCFQL